MQHEQHVDQFAPHWQQPPVQQWMAHPPAWPAPESRPQTPTGTLVLLLLMLFLLLVNVGLTVYVFFVARGLANAMQQISSMFGG